MAIKDPILFITVEEFKNSKYFNELLFDKVTTPDNEIWFAISVASSNIDYLSGFTISKKWPEIIPTDFTDNIQTATTNYVRFLLTKDVDYLRGQGSISQGGLTYSETNPDDPYFIPPEVFNYLRKIKEYPNIKGFNLKGIEPQKNNYFNKFISNCGEDSPLNQYISYTNLKSLDIRTKITITHPQNMLRPEINIDTSGINTSTTVPEFKSPKETIDIKYDKETHIVNSDVSDKVIYFDDLDNKKNAIEILKHTLVPNFIYKWVAYKNFNSFTEDYSSYLNGTLIPKKYADDKLLLKQDKLTFNNQFKNDNNTISLDTEIVFNKIDIPNVNTNSKTISGAINEVKNVNDTQDLHISQIKTKVTNVEGVLVLKQNITDDKLETNSKTIVGAINELNKRTKPLKISSKSLETNEIEDNCWDIELKDNPTPTPCPCPKWKEVAVTTDLITINYNLKNNKYYRVFYNGRTRDLITNIGKGTHEIKEFYYQDNENAFMLGIFNMMLTGMPMYIKNNGVSLYAEARMCNLWKLEELQE